MKKFLRFLLIIVIVLVLVVLVGGLFLPKETTVQESIVIKASPEVIFDYVNCMEKTSMWSPWSEMIETKEYYGPDCGVGSGQEWTQTDGRFGKQEITESIDNEYSKSSLDFGPLGTAEAEFTLAPNENGTKVTWSFLSPAPYPLGRWFSIIFGVKKFVTQDYIKGLKSLDSLITSLPSKDESVAYDSPTIIDVKSKNLLSITETVNNADIGPKMGEHYGILGQFIGMNNLKMTGYPICIWHEWNDEQSKMECGMFVEGEAEGNDQVMVSQSYEGKVVVFDYFGAYDETPNGWIQIDQYIAENELEKNGLAWVEYITDPTIETDTAKWLTRLYQPVK